MNFIEVNTWHWLCFALILLGLELFAPAAFFLWISIAAFLLSFICALTPLKISTQLIIFSLAAPIITFVGRKLCTYTNSKNKTESTLNKRGHSLIGTIHVLEQPIINGHSRITIGDSTWSVEGPDLEAGRKVRITGLNSNILIVVLVDEVGKK